MKSIKSVLLATMLGLTTVLFVGQAGMNFWDFGKNISEESEKSVGFQAEKESAILNQRLESVAKNGEFLATDLGGMYRYPIPELLNSIKRRIANDPMVFGGGFWFEPYIGIPGKKFCGPYVYKDNGKPTVTWDYNTAAYDYFKYDWYKNGFNTDKIAVWSEPYVDAVTKITMITCTNPIRRDGKVIGVTTTDISLDLLRDYVSKVKVGQKGSIFLITGQGYYFAHPDNARNLKQKISEEKDPALKHLGEEILKSTSTQFGKASIQGAKCLVAYTPIGDTGLKLVMTLPETEVYAGLNRSVKTTLVVLVIGIGLFAVLMLTVATRIILDPLKRTAILLRDIAEGEGDLTKRLEVNSADELGEMAHWFNIFIAKIQGIVTEIKSQAEELNTSANALTDISHQLDSETKSLTERSLSVASAAEQASQSVTTVSAAAEQTTANTNVVAAAAEEMTTSITEIAHNAEKVRSSAHDAVKGVEQATSKVQQLEKEAQAIGQVIDMIVEIADQTKLLALNATIEAARAGEAGKGFAVVASEVKELAKQTNTASDDIRKKIELMQHSMAGTVSEINSITNSIHRVEEEISSIASSVEEQTITTQEISSNITQSATGLREVVSTIHQNVGTMAGIASDISAVSEVTKGVRFASETMNTNANRLSAAGDELRRLVSQFKA